MEFHVVTLRWYAEGDTGTMDVVTQAEADTSVAIAKGKKLLYHKGLRFVQVYAIDWRPADL
jgi:hypothetical protein